MPSTDVILETPTAIETFELWVRVRVQLEAKIRANAEALTEATVGLDAARRTAILAPDDSDATAAVGQAIGRQRALEAERDELAERLVVARAEELAAQGPADEARRTEMRATFTGLAATHNEAVDANQDKILDHLLALAELLRDRMDLDQAAATLMRDYEQSGGTGRLDVSEQFNPGELAETLHLREHPRLLPGDQATRPRYRIEV